MGNVRSTAAIPKTLVGAGWTALFVSTAVAAGAASLLEGGYRGPLLNAGLTTAQPILAFSVAYLLFLRFGRTHQWSDLLLLHAISILGFAQVFFNPYTGIALDGFEVSRAPLLTCYFIAATTMAAAVLVQGKTARGKKGLVFLSTALAAGIPLVASMLAPQAVGAAGNAGAAPMHQSVSDFVRAGMVYVLLIAAGAGFSAVRNRSSDPFYGWLTAASTIAAFVLAPPFVAPTMGAGYTEANDVLMLAVLLLLFIGAGREVILQQDRYAREAAGIERRRLARELHDGLTQELVFIASQGNTLLKRTNDDANEGLRQITNAAERAADEARQAILALTRQSASTTGEAARELAEELTYRVGLNLLLDVDPEIEMCSGASNQLFGIMREAIANAARHGKANTVSIRLQREDGIVLEISDDGEGFEPAKIEKDRSGFGLVSMQERAHVLGGALQIRSSLGKGTKIRLTTHESASVALT